jgi:hypothetical protein
MTSTGRRANRKSLAQQLFALGRLPVTRAASVERSRLWWQGELQPTPLSRRYVVALTYAISRRAPAVEIREPELRVDGVADLPHVYDGDVLCLCYPWQWDEGKLIARTIIPWASEWLLHYEVWKVTGSWRGGGHEPITTAELA